MSVKYLGTKKLIDTEGNEIEVQYQSVQGSDKGFTKVWMADFMSKLEIIGSQKLKVAFWLIEHADKNNQINYSQRQIATASGIGLSTVRDTMKALQEADFIKRVNLIYVINPEILSKTYSSAARQGILTEYIAGEGPQNLSPEQQIENLSKTIANLQKQKKRIIEETKRIQEKKIQQVDEQLTVKYNELLDAQEKLSQTEG